MQVPSDAKSGTVTAGATAIAVGSLPLASGVYLAVPADADNGIQVISPGATDGDLIYPGKKGFYPIDNLNKVQVKRDGDGDVTVHYWGS